jgi:uncharacterized protein with GYD domain
MPSYITLGKWTEQGIRNVKESPERVRRVEQFASQVGGKLVGFYMTMGEYDFVAIIEAPDDKTVARMLLNTGSQGNARTVTLKAFPREEFERIVGSLG